MPVPMIEIRSTGRRPYLSDKPAQNRREDQLHDRVRGEQQPDHSRRGVELRSFGVKWQNGNNNPEPDEIDEDSRKDYDEG